MLVDDDRDFVDSISRILERQGYQMVSAYSAEEAREAARKCDAQVALLDIRLGQENGIGLIRELKDIRPDILCVMITAYAELESAIEALQQGAYDYLRKPVNPPDLLAGLDRYFELLALQREKFVLEEQLRQSQKLEAVGQLAAGVAHDVNNSLMAIFAYAEAARRSLPVDHRAKQNMEGITAAVAQASGVAMGLLTFSRETAPQVTPVNLGRLVSESTRLLGRMLPAAIEMTIEAAESDELWIQGDLVQLNQVLMNLLVNARDAMPDGGQLRVEVQQEPLESGDAWTAIATSKLGVVRLVVEDTGCGMSEEVLTRIFDPFFTTKARGQGTGLGMSMVHGIVESHQGRVRIESEEGRGTRVTIGFPRCEPSATADNTVARPAVIDGAGVTVLVAEDNEHVRAVVATGLEASGYTALEAKDGEEALRVFEERGDVIELAILDVDMPKMGGKACMQRLRDCRPALPIILMTGFPGRPLPADESGDMLLLHKPFRLDELARQVGKMLAKTPAARD